MLTMTAYSDRVPLPQPAEPEFRAFDYLTVRADRELESLYRDTYRGFGWAISPEPMPSGAFGVKSVTLKLKRHRNIGNRPVINALQHRATAAVQRISDLERASARIPRIVGLGCTIPGVGCVAAAVALIWMALILPAVLIGLIGAIAVAVGWWARSRSRSLWIARTAPLIDAQYEIIDDACEQAVRLLVA